MKPSGVIITVLTVGILLTALGGNRVLCALLGAALLCAVVAKLAALLFSRPGSSSRPARDRARPNYCSHCGYSLAGNTSNVCPECGHLVGSGRMWG